MAKSPSITILERDMSSYTVTSSSTVLAVVGYATKGPIGKATLVTSRSEFNQVFGEPVEESPYAALAVYRAFNQGNQVIFYRVADDTATSAEVALTNQIPGTYASQAIELGSGGFTGLTAETSYSFIVTIDGTDYPVIISTGVGETEVTVSSVLSSIAAAIDGVGTVALSGSQVVVMSNVIGTAGSVAITDGDFITTVALDNTEAAIKKAVAGINPTTDQTDNIMFKAKEKGSSTNLISLFKSSRVNPITLETVHKLEILYDGEVVETYDEISLVPSSASFFAKQINADSDNGGSDYLTVVYEDVEGDDAIAFNDNAEGEYYTLGTGTDEYTVGDSLGDYDYKVGTNGVPTEAADATGLFIDALATDGDLANAEENDYHILITPDVPVAEIQEAALTLANFRKDFIYIVDPPMGLKAAEVADWHNGKGYGRSSAINNSYAALYWPWLKDYNPSSKEYIWCPPSVFIAEKFMEVDRLYGPWYAPAGDSRGRISASDYETSPSFSQRELIYGDFNAVNPFVNFTSKGLLVYGQKTLIRSNSAVNRVNTRRMIIYIKKLVKQAMDSMLFEPHNPDSWKRATGKITAILEPIRQNNGLDQYKVIIDGTTNTTDLIAQSIMKGIIKIVPTGTIEIIELTLQVNKAGSSLDE